MVTTPLLEQAGFGKKRDSRVIDQDQEPCTTSSDCSDMKKPRIAAGEETIEGDRDYPPSPAGRTNTEDIKARINKYLEVRLRISDLNTGAEKYISNFQDNKSLKYVEVEKMAKTLHENYPEYKRRKFKVFKSQVDTAFKICCDEMASKRKEKKKSSVASTSKSLPVEEIRRVINTSLVIM